MFSGPWGIVVMRVSWPGHPTLIKKKKSEFGTEACGLAVLNPTSASWVQASACMSVTPAIFYLFTRLARYAMGPGNNHGVHKLARTLWIIKK